MIADKAVKLAVKMGAEQAEAYVTRSRRIRLIIEGNRIPVVERSSSNSLRVMSIIDKRVGLASVYGQLDRLVEKAVDESISLAKASERDPNFESLLSPMPPADVKEIFDDEIAEISSDKNINLGLEIVETANRSGADIVLCELSLSTSYRELVNSEGVCFSYDKTRAYINITLASRKGSSEMYLYRSSTFLDDLDVVNLVEYASRIAVDTSEPRRVEPFKGTVILGSDAVADIFQGIIYAVNADNVRRRRSRFTGMLNEKVASEKLTIVDDGTLSRGVGSAPYDGEGCTMKRKTVIENGVLKNYLYDSYTARLLRAELTGNASFRRPLPSITATNFIVNPGTKNLEELIGKVDKGLWVPRIPPSFLNFVTGDFSAELRNAFLIENGEIKYPVRWGMISGNIFEMIRNIVEIGSDQTIVGRIITPSIVFGNVNISGVKQS